MPPGPPPAKKKSKAPLIIGLAVVALLVVGAVVAAALVVLGGGVDGELAAATQQPVDRVEAEQAVAAAVIDGDPVGVTDAAAAAGDDLGEATPLSLGEDVSVTLGGTGLAVLSFEGSTTETYGVNAAADGDVILSTAVQADDGPATAPASTFDGLADGPHRLFVAAEGAKGTEVVVSLFPIEVVAFDPARDRAVDGDITASSPAVDYEMELEAEQHYLIELETSDDLVATVYDPEGNEVATEPDPDLDVPRFVAASSGTFTVRVTGPDGAEGSYSFEATLVPEFYYFYDSDDSSLEISPTTTQFSPPVNPATNRAHFCLFLRAGVSMDLDISVTTAELDLSIDVFDHTESGDLVARINENGPGGNETWSVTATDDVVRCFQLWGVDYSGGSFGVRFTSST